MTYTDGNNDPQLAVVIQGLVKAYGDFKAVDGLNLQVPAGGVYGLLRPKRSLLEHQPSYSDPQS